MDASAEQCKLKMGASLLAHLGEVRNFNSSNRPRAILKSGSPDAYRRANRID